MEDDRAGQIPRIDMSCFDALSNPDTCAGRLQRAAYQLLMDHEDAGEIPTNGRFIFYELEGMGVVFKPKKGERRGTADRPGPMELTEALTVLRKVGLVPWDWIVDETRTLHEWEYSSSVAEYVRDALEYARINPWDGEPPLLLVESRSLGGVLRHHMGRYLVPIAATNGQVGGFLHTDVIPLLARAERPVIYLGDLDLQGEQIEENTRRVLEGELQCDLEWERIAITMDQVREHGLEPLKKSDHRYRPAKTFDAWECEALGQREITELVTAALDRLLPTSLESVHAREGDERARLEEFLDGWDD